MSLLGLDIGTSGCKAAVFNTDGEILALAKRSYPLHTARDHLELDPDEVWNSAASCIRQVNGEVGHNPVTALATSVLGEAVIPIGADGRPLARSPVSFDGRAIEQANAFQQSFDDGKIYLHTGQPIHPMYSIHKIVWWRDNIPTLFESTWKFLCYGDFVALKLGVEPAIDYSMAARTQAFDINTKSWSEDILQWAGLSAAQLAVPVPSGTVLGGVDPEIRQELGFTEDVLVIAGGHDQPCGALGSGALKVGEAMYALGTTACLAPTLPGLALSLSKYGFPCYPHVIPDCFVTLAGTSSGGSLLRWFRDVFGDREQQIAAKEGRDIYDVLVAQADEEPSPLLLLPHFAGTEAPHHDPGARGVLFGLSFATTRGDVIQAILEGIALEIASYTCYLDRCGVELGSLRAVGGGAKSARWMQLNADVIGLPITVPQVTEATCLGAALVAGTATKCYASLRDAVDLVVSDAHVYEPHPERSAYYRSRLSYYQRAYPAIRWLNPLLKQPTGTML